MPSSTLYNMGGGTKCPDNFILAIAIFLVKIEPFLWVKAKSQMNKIFKGTDQGFGSPTAQIKNLQENQVGAFWFYKFL